MFGEERLYLLQKLVDEPARFVGLFRSTTPKLKIIQNLLQSREIRFGDALEEIITSQIIEMGFIYLDRVVVVDGGETLDYDHYFMSPSGEEYFLVEQKVRDDHDSTKREVS